MIEARVLLPSGHIENFDDVDFISFVTSTTYGKPAIIAPGTDEFVRASERGEDVRVLYLNPGQVAAVEATKAAE